MFLENTGNTVNNVLSWTQIDNELINSTCKEDKESEENIKNTETNTKNKIEIKSENKDDKKNMNISNASANVLNHESVRTHTTHTTTQKIIENKTSNNTLLFLNQRDHNNDNKDKNINKKGFFSFLMGQSDYEEIITHENECDSDHENEHESIELLPLPSSTFPTVEPVLQNTTSFSSSWGRNLQYSRINNNNKIFSSSPEHYIFQIMNVKKSETNCRILLDNNDKRNENLIIKSYENNDKIVKINENGSISVYKNMNVTDSVTIISYSNISHLPFCANSSFKITYEFHNLNSNSNINDNKNNKIDNNIDKINNDINDIEIKDKKVSFSIYLEVQCPSSLVRPFVVSGIKKELKEFAKKLQFLIDKNLNEKNNFIENKNFVTGNGEIEIFKFIEKNYQKYQIKKNDKNIIENSISNENENENENKDINDYQFKLLSNKYDDIENNFARINDDEDYEIFRKKNENEFEQNVNTNLNSYSDKYQYSPISSDFSVGFPNDEISAKFIRLRDHW